MGRWPKTLLTVGRLLTIRLIIFLALFFSGLFAVLYWLYGPVVAVQFSGGGFAISLIALLVGIWDRFDRGLTQRLQYLNQYAFSPLLTECGPVAHGWRITPRKEAVAKALEVLKRNARYLTLRIYPKQLVPLTERVLELSGSYDALWIDVYNTGEKWVADHQQTWGGMGSFDMGALHYVLGYTGTYSTYPENKIAAVNGFVDWYSREHGKEFERFLSSHKELDEKEKATVALLNEYMQTNMLHRVQTNP